MLCAQESYNSFSYLLLLQQDVQNQQYDAEDSKSKDKDAVHQESFLIGHNLWHDCVGLRLRGGVFRFRLMIVQKMSYWKHG